MKVPAAGATAQTITSNAKPLVQRQCACGAPASDLTGSCRECGRSASLGALARLEIGALDSPIERDAERMADQILSIDPEAEARPARSMPVNAMAAREPGRPLAPPSVHQTLTSPGKPLSDVERRFFEPRLGHDFGEVRVHTGAAAAASARELRARAYTVGRHIAFAADQFAPETQAGKRLLAHELTHVAQAAPPTRLARAPEDASETNESPDPSGAVTRCSDEVSFNVQKLTPILRPDPLRPRLNADAKLTIPNAEFDLKAKVRAHKHGDVKDRNVRQWQIGFIQNVHLSSAQLDYGLPESRDELVDCGRSEQTETHVDCADQGPWYSTTKRAFVRLPRFLQMNDHPWLEQVDLINGERSVLRRLQRAFKASAYLVAEKNKNYCVLDRVDWGFSQDDRFTPTVEATPQGVIPVGIGSVEKNLQLEQPVQLGPASGAPLTSGGCHPQPPFEECPDSTPTPQAAPANQQPAPTGGANATPRVQRALSRASANEDDRPRRGALATAPTLALRRSRRPERGAKRPESAGAVLDQQIDAFQNACSGVAGVKCVGGEIVPSLPPCMEEAPCGVGDCIRQHEMQHAEDLVELFRERLGRHPCRQPDGRPFADGFAGFGDHFIAETDQARAWKRFLLRSERKAYGVGLKCLREAGRASTDRRCKRVLTNEAAKSAFRRFLATIGINPSG